MSRILAQISVKHARHSHRRLNWHEANYSEMSLFGDHFSPNRHASARIFVVVVVASRAVSLQCACAVAPDIASGRRRFRRHRSVTELAIDRVGGAASSWPRPRPVSTGAGRRARLAAWATLVAARRRARFLSLYDTKRILTYQKVDGTSKRRHWQRDVDFWQTSLHTSVTKEDDCHATRPLRLPTSYPDVSWKDELACACVCFPVSVIMCR